MWYIIAALAAALVFFCLLARRMGRSPAEILELVKTGGGKALNVAKVLIVIGVVTGVWRAAGTIVVFVCYGVQLIRPELFLLIAFGLAAVLSFALGTSFGVAGTVGVIFMTLARSGGVNPVITGGVLLSGVFFGDRGSPVSSTAILVSALTKTDLIGNVKRMAKTGLLPLLLCLVFYTFLSLKNPLQAVDASVTASLSGAFSLTLWAFLPAALLLILPLLRVPVLVSMGLSILSGAAVALTAQGMDLLTFLKSCVLGYHSDVPQVAAILNGGGIASMISSCAIIILACASAEVAEGSGMLNQVEKLAGRVSEKIGYFPAMILTSLCASAVFCNQVIAIVLSHTFFKPMYEKQGLSRETQALDMENCCITVPAFVPWSIICSVPLQLLGTDYRSMLYASFLYLVPLIHWLRLALSRKTL